MKHLKLNGFTIIEVTLTLAIGGLIFAMVFFALPSVMANSRDGQRRDAIMLTVSKLKNFQANNNRGALPTDRISTAGLLINGSTISFGATTGVTWADFYKGFFDDSYADPSGARYNWQIVNCEGNGTSDPCKNTKLANYLNTDFRNSNSTIYFVISATCGDGIAISTPNNRMVAVLYNLERGGTYCINT